MDDKRIHLGLQYFADDTAGTDTANTETATEQGGAQKNPAGGDPTSKPEQKPEKTFSQAELDAAIEARLARERKNVPTKDELKAFKEWKDSRKTAEEKTADEIKAAQDAQAAAEKRAAELDAKYTAMIKGVKPDAVDDVIALALGKVSDTVTLEQAIDAVLAKYPLFGGTQQPTPAGITTSTPSGGGAKPTGVEAAFLAKNPGLKI